MPSHSQHVTNDVDTADPNDLNNPTNSDPDRSGRWREPQSARGSAGDFEGELDEDTFWRTRPSVPTNGLYAEIPDAWTTNFDEVEDPVDGQRWSTWLAVERGARGPEPRPDWVVTDEAAVDTELGVLKTGKEADVFLVERAVPEDDSRRVVMAAKRYRSEEHRTFHRSSVYTEGRRTRRSRDARAMAKKTTHGRSVAAGEWAYAEFDALSKLWAAGVPVPYPVQIDGVELLMELITVDGNPAPRLAQVRPEPELLASYFAQLTDAMAALARGGWAHGDLSAYNILAAGARLVIIDLPQLVDIVGNPKGMELLERDCRNVCSWFRSRGLQVDEHELVGELIAQSFGGQSSSGQSSSSQSSSGG